MKGDDWNGSHDHAGHGNNTTMDESIFQPLNNDRVLVAFTAAYGLIFLVGLVGNLLTCLVVFRRHYVHAQTPFYLNLAFSDLILLIVGLPIDVYFFWYPFRPLGGTWFCILKAVLTESATNASILTIVVFTAERWTSICRPGKSSSNFINSAGNGWRFGFGQGRNGKYVIMLIWITALLAAVPLSAQLGLVPYDPQSEESSVCTCNIVRERRVPYSFEVSSITFFVIPMILITVFYSSIIVQLRRTVARQSSVNDSPLMHVAGKARQQAKASGAVVKILIAVVVAFFICFLPHHLQRLSATYVNDLQDPEWASSLQLLFTISGLCYYISTAVNPVIYCLLSKRFRFALQNQLLCHRRRHRKSTRQHFSNDLILLKQLNRRALLLKAKTTQNGCITVSKNRLRYPISCPVARKHGLDIPGLPCNNPVASPVRPDTLSVSSVYVQQNGKTPIKISRHSSPGLSRIGKDGGSTNSRRNLDVGSGWNQRNGTSLIDQRGQSDCYNVFLDGDKIVISFVSDAAKSGNSV